jgi:hypothetical protein
LQKPDKRIHWFLPEHRLVWTSLHEPGVPEADALQRVRLHPDSC